MYFKGLCCVLFTLLILACEDNKKDASHKDQSTTIEQTAPKTAVKDTTDQNQPNGPEETDSISYQLLTNQNVVEFLTRYGKNNKENKVRISTTLGDIDMVLYEDTPLHRANFIYLVKQGYFNSTVFHRVVPDFIIQGGNSDNIRTAKHRARIGKYLLPAEIVPDRLHSYGTVSGAKEYRKNPDKRTAPFEFFIFLGPKSATGHLNGNYTIFGRVTSGMDVVEKIANLESDEGDWPLQNIYISIEIIP
jgi:peptidylprolyl isomerase